MKGLGNSLQPVSGKKAKSSFLEVILSPEMSMQPVFPFPALTLGQGYTRNNISFTFTSLLIDNLLLLLSTR